MICERKTKGTGGIFSFSLPSYTFLNYMGDVTSPGEFCVLPVGVIPDPHGSGEKLKNPNGDVTQLVVGVFINSSVLLPALSVN